MQRRRMLTHPKVNWLDFFYNLIVPGQTLTTISVFLALFVPYLDYIALFSALEIV